MVLPLQGAVWLRHTHPGRCPGLGDTAPAGRFFRSLFIHPKLELRQLYTFRPYSFYYQEFENLRIFFVA